MIWVSVPCPVERVIELRDLLGTGGLQHPPEQTVVITTPGHQIAYEDISDLAATVLTAPDDELTYGRWHNLALDWIARRVPAGAVYEVALLNSDCIGGPRDLPRLATAMRVNGWVAASPDPHGIVPPGCQFVDRTLRDPRTVYDRLSPHAFLIAAELGLRFDPQFRWYYSDDDLEMQLRTRGTVGLLAGCGPAHPGHALLNDTMQQQAEVDRARFVAKWEREPWV